MHKLYDRLSDIVNGTYRRNELTKKIEHCAALLLLNYCFVVGQVHYQLIDIEFYFNDSKEHADPYAHSAQYPNRVKQKQSVIGAWYFHRFAGMATYTHTRRGLDLTFGNGDRDVYGGILIRSIRRLSDGIIITGPSRVVQEIIQSMQDPSAIEEAAQDLVAGYAFNAANALRLEACAVGFDGSVCKRPRFGLSDKNPYYRDLEYRFFTNITDRNES